MNIAVVSPHNGGNGTTTVAALVAAELGFRNKKVCLTHTKSISESFVPYFKLREADATNNPAQLVNLINMGGLKKESFPNYCRNIIKECDLFSINQKPEDGGFDQQDITNVIEFVLTNSPYDYVVVDVDEHDLNAPTVDAVIRNCDCIILVLTQKTVELRRFYEKKNNFLLKTKGMPIITVINKYLPLLGTKEDLGKMIGITNRQIISHFQLLHRNQYILAFENKGDLNKLMQHIQNREADVVELDTDVKAIVRQIQTIRTVKRRMKIEYSRKED